MYNLRCRILNENHEFIVPHTVNRLIIHNIYVLLRTYQVMVSQKSRQLQSSTTEWSLAVYIGCKMRLTFPKKYENGNTKYLHSILSYMSNYKFVNFMSQLLPSCCFLGRVISLNEFNYYMFNFSKHICRIDDGMSKKRLHFESYSISAYIKKIHAVFTNTTIQFYHLMDYM